jgi:hypothetical protein
VKERHSTADEETSENRILAYEARRMIAIRIERPPLRRAVTAYCLGDNRTHIRGASMGYGTDEKSAAMRSFFEAGNASTLETICTAGDLVTGDLVVAP